MNKNLFDKATNTKKEYKYESVFVNDDDIIALKTTGEGQFKHPTFIIEHDDLVYFADLKYAIKAKIKPVNYDSKLVEGYIVKVKKENPILKGDIYLGTVEEINGKQPKISDVIKCLTSKPAKTLN